MVIILNGQHGPIVVKLAVGVLRRVQEPAQIPYHNTVEKTALNWSQLLRLWIAARILVVSKYVVFTCITRIILTSVDYFW